ncbi:MULTISPECIES: glycosyltransferase [unclassified Paenibacillus]|uniref:glycosyltransferase n=1 Tax=unclassified Paenibacillus TaxID=185978 RepID=UPI002405A3D5|nr:MULTISPECIES: glycosyltransferase [unclassified Paenibacillus]MDF9840213.1 glycosyltransferase involved in cell wall biosynthesis [Paenibacillus sp. PastF-2]MDF9846795.1 glycosyltransferase involved in cell wall biosynthesis [Paenibacillus sp. PastM-2]MDF9852856.1 glycosyltransferase involved in cell wall biosynthesis [Paenibacillus sp. PastF-1]MDH6478639.1 glycosyltransferase involved in cell wall biosynthesis [Paenibacillus sp. PastH-2]MDH6505863.1 glycosyltransferase involved in cell wal
MKLNNFRFSIVICTYNRDEYLERTLESLNNLYYDDFEVIVVNGPSTDRTDEILEKYKNKIKLGKNNVANLSISRNIGIKLSSGDIVAFLDDDAIPEPNWLDQIQELYDSNGFVGGVGGRVYGPGGDHFQFHNGIINVWGEATAKCDQPGQYTEKNGNYYNILMGVNSTFLRKALVNIGGFDEYYEYYHDESDVCVRLINSGHPIYHHQEAFVHHEFAKSHIRKSIYNLNWYPIVKNTVYFGVKNSKGIHNLAKRISMPFFTSYKRLLEFKHWLKNGDITKKEYRSFRKMWISGAYRGFIDGFFSARKTNNNLEGEFKFCLFEKKSGVSVENKQPQVIGDLFGICLLSRYYPPYGKGGVATYTKSLAEGLVKRGHPVYVITSGLPTDQVEINGVKLIDINIAQNIDLYDYISKDKMNVTKTNLDYSSRVASIVGYLYDNNMIKVLETPLWDYEGLASTRIDGLKTFVRLETPLKIAAKTQEWKWNKDLELSSQLEKQLIQGVDEVITISNDVQNNIGDLYDIDWNNLNVSLVPLGIDDVFLPEIQSEFVGSENELTILFLGRLERRKGIDILLEAAKEITSINKDVKFILAGNNNIPFYNETTIKDSFVKENPTLSEQIVFLGEISDEEKLKLLSNCDVFVAPSRYESFGLVFLEAMQLGKPVIGTYVGGIKEIVDDGVNGLLVESEKPQLLKEALLRLIGDSALRKSMGLKAREKYVKDFQTDSMIDRTLECYRKQFAN